MRKERIRKIWKALARQITGIKRHRAVCSLGSRWILEIENKNSFKSKIKFFFNDCFETYLQHHKTQLYWKQIT